MTKPISVQATKWVITAANVLTILCVLFCVLLVSKAGGIVASTGAPDDRMTTYLIFVVSALYIFFAWVMSVRARRSRSIWRALAPLAPPVLLVALILLS